MITSETSSVRGFVAELVRAANEVDRLTASEIESLLLRAITTPQFGDNANSTEAIAPVC